MQSPPAYVHQFTIISIPDEMVEMIDSSAFSSSPSSQNVESVKKKVLTKRGRRKRDRNIMKKEAEYKTLDPYRRKRLKNNLGSALSRDRRNEKVKSKEQELIALTQKNTKLRRKAEQNEKIIKELRVMLASLDLQDHQEYFEVLQSEDEAPPHHSQIFNSSILTSSPSKRGRRKRDRNNMRREAEDKSLDRVKLGVLKNNKASAEYRDRRLMKQGKMEQILDMESEKYCRLSLTFLKNEKKINKLRASIAKIKH